MPHEEAIDAVVTTLRNAQPDALSADAVAERARDDDRGVSQTDARDALDALVEQNRIERLEESNGTVRYRAK